MQPSEEVVPPEIVLPSWNTRDLLLDCLDRLARGVPPERVIVVDNASGDGTAEAVQARFPRVRLVRSQQNLGFAGAVNRGLRLRADPESPVLLLNADTVFEPRMPEQLVRRLAEMDATAAVSPALRLSDGRPQPYAFGREPRPGYLFRRGWNRLVHHRALHDWDPQNTIQTDWVSFACVLLSAGALSQVGELDEGYFMYFEDCDWCLRARRAGWNILYEPALRVTHLGGASLKQNPSAAAAYRDSLRRFYRKHYGWPARVALYALLPLYAHMASRSSG